MSARGFITNKKSLLQGMLIGAMLAASCSAPYTWIAEHEQLSARAPEAPERCENEPLGFTPENHVLLGGKASNFWRWAQQELPDNFRLGRNGRVALMPNKTPGVAMHVTVHNGVVSSLLVQSHSNSPGTARPLSRDAVRRFLLDATGCSVYKLCHARANIDSIRFQGHTTCSASQAPMKLVTPSHGHSIISVAVWMPSLSSPATSSSPQWNASP